MLQPDSIGQWLRHWLYDWGGLNIQLFIVINRALPNEWLWLPEALSDWGSYWGAPGVVLLLLLWRPVQPRAKRERLVRSVHFLVAGLILALLAAALSKAALAMPRPFDILGHGVYRTATVPDSRFTMPSGHATYIGVLAAALWPALGWPGRAALLLFGTSVGWSRVVLGAHFPADVVAGFGLGWICVVAVGPLVRRFAPKLAWAESRP